MSSPKPAEKHTIKVQFHYIKSPEYRETACHGAIGGVTPQKKIWMALYSERGPIPRLVEFELEAPEGASGVEFNEKTEKPSHVEGRQGVIRQVDSTAYMDLEVAVRLYSWLGERIADLQRDEKKTSPGIAGEEEKS